MLNSHKEDLNSIAGASEWYNDTGRFDFHNGFLYIIVEVMTIYGQKFLSLTLSMNRRWDLYLGSPTQRAIKVVGDLFSPPQSYWHSN